MGVAGVVEAGQGGGDLGHGGEADAQVGVGVHGEPDAVRAAERGEFAGAVEAAPVVVVAEDDPYRPLREGLRDLLEGGHAHVGGERYVGAGGDLGHGAGAARRVLQVLQDVLQLAGDGERGLHGPGAVGVEAERPAGERLGERPDRGDLPLGLEHAALELEGAEAVLPVEAAGLFDDAGGVEGRAPAVGAGPLVEEVGAVLDLVADLAAEEGVDGQAEGLAEGVQAGGLEGGGDGEAELLGGTDPPQAGGVDARVRAGGGASPLSAARAKRPFTSVTERPGSASASGRAMSR